MTKKYDKGVGTMGSVNAASSTRYKEMMKPDQTRTDILMLAENDPYITLSSTPTPPNTDRPVSILYQQQVYQNQYTNPLRTTSQHPETPMCVHSLYIFTKCGHFLFSEEPVLPCSSFPVCHKSHRGLSSSAQNMSAHPLQSRRLDSACAACKRRAVREEREREQRLQEVRIWTKDIKVEEARWRIHFGPKQGEGPVVVRGLTEGMSGNGRTHERSMRKLEEGRV